MKYEPRPYQTLITDHQLNTPRSATWAGMGMGKTVATLKTLSVLELLEDRPALIIAPKRVAMNVWPGEVEKWDDFRGLRTSVMCGTPEQRREALNTKADMYTINYENIPWLVAEMKGKQRFSTIVVDESTRIKGYRLRGGSIRARELKKFAFYGISNFIELTGTPSPNGLQDLWGQMWFLDRGERLGRTYTAFKNRWFRQPPGNFFAKLTPVEWADEQIHEAVKDVSISLQAKDWFDITEPIECDVPVYLTGRLRKMYDKLEKELFLELSDGTEIEAFSMAAKTMKCLQFASGVLYEEGGQTWKEIHALKLEALESVVEEAAGMPVLVAYHFKSDLKRILDKFPQASKLDNNIDKWNRGEIPIGCIHPASAGHGLNLQDGGNIIVIYSHWWDAELYDQVIERIGPVRQLQAGYDRPVFIYSIRCTGTMDDRVIYARRNKKSIQDALMEAVNGRR